MVEYVYCCVQLISVLMYVTPLQKEDECVSSNSFPEHPLTPSLALR